MNKRKCYSYHPTTFVYQGLETAYECQVETGVYILPDHSTFVAPPLETPSTNNIYVWTGENWVCQNKLIKEPIQDNENETPIQEINVKERIDILMNVKQELLREIQNLLSKYKFFSQELEKLWFEHNTSQLNITSNS